MTKNEENDDVWVEGAAAWAWVNPLFFGHARGFRIPEFFLMTNRIHINLTNEAKNKLDRMVGTAEKIYRKGASYSSIIEVLILQKAKDPAEAVRDEIRRHALEITRLRELEEEIVSESKKSVAEQIIESTEKVVKAK